MPAHVDDPSWFLCEAQMNLYFMTLFLPTSYGSHWSHFSKKLCKFWKMKKKYFFCFDTKGKLFLKNWKNWIFFQKSNCFKLNLNSTCSKLFFKVHNIEFVQNFEFFIFLAINFSLLSNFIPWPLAAKLIIKGECFYYQWTAKDQNIHFWSSFTI